MEKGNKVEWSGEERERERERESKRGNGERRNNDEDFDCVTIFTSCPTVLPCSNVDILQFPTANCLNYTPKAGIPSK